jgi:hypothetical protein
MNNLTISVDYFKSLIDDNGVVQFSSRYHKDHASGYAVEDQARGLIAALWLNDIPTADHLYQLLVKARTPKGVRMIRQADGSYTNQLDAPEKEASAEVLWALGEQYAVAPKEGLKDYAHQLIQGLEGSPYSKALAYGLLGTSKLGHHGATEKMADGLVDMYHQYADENWAWFSDNLTYANALHPWGLLAAYQLVPKAEYRSVGLSSLNFLLTHLKLYRIPVLVGNDGEWWRKGRTMPLFDQQPIDAAYLTLACLKAFEITENQFYLDKAKFYYSWFHGNNIHRASMIRPDGACYDGLNNTGPNQNAGAESTICYILASLAMLQVGGLEK